MSKLEFIKMNASGNDFVMIDNLKGEFYQRCKDIEEFVVKVCRRRHSVGADGLILIEGSKSEDADFSWRFFNADGSEADMCGNGGRCAARFAFKKGIAGSKMAFETGAGIIKAEIDGTRVKLQLTAPTDLKLDYSIKLENREIFINSVNSGVPHAVLLSDDIDYVPVEELGRTLRYHTAFGENGTNVNFVKVVDKTNLIIRTYERGVEAETYACGTGAAASGIILKEKGLIESPVNILTRGGETLKVYVGEEVYLEGDTRIVYTAELDEEALK